MISALLLMLIVVGIVLWLVPMDGGIKGWIVKICGVVTVVVLVLWVCQMLGINLRHLSNF